MDYFLSPYTQLHIQLYLVTGSRQNVPTVNVKATFGPGTV